MKIIIPYVGELCGPDARLVRLAHFLGVPCEILALPDVADHAEFLAKGVPDDCSCFVVNPRVMRDWMGISGIPADTISFLVSRFPHLLVHGLRANDIDAGVVRALSQNKLESIDAINGNSVYAVAKDSQDICKTFSGLSFGPVNPVNDHVFSVRGGDPAVRPLISIGGRPFMASLRVKTAEILFVAGEDVVDVDAEVSDSPLTQYFSRFIPQSMALRYMAQDECWRSTHCHATLIIDDPLLRKSYGFLNFTRLIRLMETYHFHTSIAFIPHNYKRNSKDIIQMFRENPERLSVCFHGNDHTGAEFAENDTSVLNAFVKSAKNRMEVLHNTTGLKCDEVMVFPQGEFSKNAMITLKANNFCAAVNSGFSPSGELASLTIAQLIAPAILKYGGLALFLRSYPRAITPQDIAFNVFFGKPILIVEHHQVFKDPRCLTELVSRINEMVPNIKWSNLQTAVEHSYLTRRASDGICHIRSYASVAHIENTLDAPCQFALEFCGSGESAIDGVLSNGAPVSYTVSEKQLVELRAELPARSSARIEILYRNDLGVSGTNLRIGWRTKALLRRRLSEIRDNYFSKNQSLLSAAKSLHSRFLGDLV